jgi:hypothetical protein
VLVHGSTMCDHVGAYGPWWPVSPLCHVVEGREVLVFRCGVGGLSLLRHLLLHAHVASGNFSRLEP